MSSGQELTSIIYDTGIAVVSDTKGVAVCCFSNRDSAHSQERDANCAQGLCAEKEAGHLQGSVQSP